MSAIEDALEAGTTVEGVLQRIIEEYYEGCKRYAAAPQPDSPERVFWRVRLGVLGKYGSLLAAALGQAEPDWEAIRDVAVVADSLPAIRRRHGVSQLDVANVLDVTQTRVCHWELGRYQVPDEVSARWEDVCREAAKLKGKAR